MFYKQVLFYGIVFQRHHETFVDLSQYFRKIILLKASTQSVELNPRVTKAILSCLTDRGWYILKYLVRLLWWYKVNGSPNSLLLHTLITIIGVGQRCRLLPVCYLQFTLLPIRLLTRKYNYMYHQKQVKEVKEIVICRFHSLTTTTWLNERMLECFFERASDTCIC